MSFAFMRADIENFRSFRGRHLINLDLPPGVYYVTGDNQVEPELEANGAGKSTIFEAVYWCLTGRLMTMSRPGDEVAPWGAPTKKVKVKLWFEKDGERYSLTRSRHPNKLLLHSHEALAKEPRAVEQYEVTQLIGLNDEALKRTLIQGQFSQLFLDLKPDAQSAMFSEVLDLDLWLRAAGRASQQASKLARLVDGQVSAAAANNGRYDALYGQWEQAKADAEAWGGQQAAKIGRLGEALAEAAQELALAGAALAALPAPATADAHLEQIRASIAAKKATVATKEAAGRQLLRESDRLLREKQAKEAEAARLEADIARFNAAKKTRTCPECGQEVALSHLSGRLEALRSSHVEATEQAGSFTQPMANNRAERDALDEELATLASAITALEFEMAPAVRSGQQAQQARRDAEREADRKEGAHGQAKRALDAERAATNPHTDRVTKLKADLTALNKTIEDEEKRLSQTRADLERVQLCSTYFKEIRLSMIEEVLLELEVTSNEFAEQLGLHGWQIKFATERETKAGSTAVGFTTIICPPGEPAVPWELFSGGERQRWQLAVTFALSEVLLERAGLTSNLEVLDEPSKGIAAGGLTQLIDHLRQRARNKNKAILLVDHHALDRGAFDKVMVVVRDANGSRLEVR